jgi:hypothetical protein
MFGTTRNKGFHITFENGWTVSVQFGPGNYCEHHFALNLPRASETLGVPPEGIESEDAEIAAWDADGKWFKFKNDKVEGYQSPAEVLKFMNKIARKSRKELNHVK